MCRLCSCGEERNPLSLVFQNLNTVCLSSVYSCPSSHNNKSVFRKSDCQAQPSFVLHLTIMTFLLWFQSTDQFFRVLCSFDLFPCSTLNSYWHNIHLGSLWIACWRLPTISLIRPVPFTITFTSCVQFHESFSRTSLAAGPTAVSL